MIFFNRLFLDIGRETQGCLSSRNVCKYTDFFVLFSESACRVESNFNFSFFSGRDRGFFVVYGSASATGFDVLNYQVTVTRVLEVECVGDLFPLGDGAEIPVLFSPFYLSVCLYVVGFLFPTGGQEQYGKKQQEVASVYGNAHHYMLRGGLEYQMFDGIVLVTDVAQDLNSDFQMLSDKILGDLLVGSGCLDAFRNHRTVRHQQQCA